jgi:hypothetical protein
VRTVAVLAETRLAIFLGGRQWVVDITSVQCLKNRLRSMFRCPRAHEGNFQSLYYRSGELACRHCHALRYRSNVASTVTDRARIARAKLLSKMNAEPDELVPARRRYKWRSRHARLSARLARLTSVHYRAIRAWLQRQVLDDNEKI